MKKVEAIIQPFKFDEVKEALSTHGIEGMTVFEARGFGHEKGPREVFRGREFIGDLSKIKIEIIVPDDRVDLIVRVLRNTARTGKVGDGKVFVSSVEEIYPIRTEDKTFAS